MLNTSVKLGFCGALLVFSAGCSTTGGEYVVDPATSKSMVNYQADLQACKAIAEQNSSMGSDAAVGAAAGAALGAVTGVILGDSGSWAGSGAGAGAVSGAASGAWRGYEQKHEMVRRCLRARGYTVLK